jgi:hypothetical protein
MAVSVFFENTAANFLGELLAALLILLITAGLAFTKKSVLSRDKKRELLTNLLLLKKI